MPRRPQSPMARVKQRLSRLKPLLEGMLAIECRLAAAWARSAHRRLMLVQWEIPPQPENFDHHIDLFYLWQRTRNPQWVERGVFGALALRGGRVLELCCGDGFNARNFYSLASKEVLACDFDPAILAVARRKNGAPNVRYVRADIRRAMPAGTFANVVWDAAVEHFTPAEIDAILEDVKARLGPGGVLGGHTVVEKGAGRKHLCHHEYEFRDKADLDRFLTPHFANVSVFETAWPGRRNLYFWASDGPVPFSPGWDRAY